LTEPQERTTRCRRCGIRLENRIKRIVSIGTGVLSLEPFRGDAFHIGKTLIAIATDTEQMVERLQIIPWQYWLILPIQRGARTGGYRARRVEEEEGIACGYTTKYPVSRDVQADASVYS
jgi:hypothetical protein